MADESRLVCVSLELKLNEHLLVSTRFQAVERSSHSTGALYLTLCNNPRNIRFLREETELLMALPGPLEPSLEEMNNVMDLFVDHMYALGKGMLEVHA